MEKKNSNEITVKIKCDINVFYDTIEKRGFIRKGFKADLVIVARNKHWSLTKDKILSKCGWSPYENRSFTTQVQYTFVNGIPVFKKGEFNETARGQELSFVR